MPTTYIFDYPPSAEELANKPLADCYCLRNEGVALGCQLLELPEASRKAINHQVMEDLLALGDKQVAGKTIRSWVGFAHTSLWYLHKFRLYFDLRNLSYDIGAIEQLAAQAGDIVLFSRKKVWDQIPLLPPQVKLHLQPSPPTNQRWGMLLQFGLLLFWRLVLSLGQWRHLRRANFLLINRPANEVPMTMPETLDIQHENYYYGYILPQLPKDFLVFEEIDHPKPQGDTTYQISKRMWRPRKGLNQIGTDAILIRGLLRRSVRKQAKNIAAGFATAYPQVASHLDQPFEQVAWWWFQQLHGSSRFFAYKYAAYAWFFARQSFQALLIVDEASPPVRLVWEAARSQSIPVVALQHGTIHSLHMGYRYTAQDQAEFMPVPEQTWTWGQHWTDVLQAEGHYPAERLAVVGQARADIIPHLKQLGKSAVRPEFDDHRPLIVFATQPQRDPEMRKRAAADAFRMAMQLPDIQLVLKLHPRETVPAYYHDIAKEVGCTNYLIPPQVDLYRLMAVCDGLITCFSTVGAEVVYFNKPLIILDHLEQDVQGYKAAGVAFQAVDAATLTEIIRGLIQGKLVLDQDAYDHFQATYAFQGNLPISQHIIERIRRVAEERN